MLDELAPLAQRMVDDCEIIWDGRNHVARLGADGVAAEEEIIARLGGEEFGEGDMYAWWEDEEDGEDAG